MRTYDGVNVDDLSLGAAPRQVRDDQLLLIVVRPCNTSNRGDVSAYTNYPGM